MLFAGCKTDIQTPDVFKFVQSKTLVDDIKQLITPDVRRIGASSSSLSLDQTDDFDKVEAVFIEVDGPESINDSLELVKSIRAVNDFACVFILVTHTKPFSSVSYYLAGADHCIKLPSDLEEKSKLLSRTFEDSHLRTTTQLRLDRTRLLLHNSTCKLDISYTEMIIIDALMRAPQHVMSQDSIAKTLDPNVVFYDPRALEKTISRLRTKIKKSYNLELIISVRAFGYRLRRGTVFG